MNQFFLLFYFLPFLAGISAEQPFVILPASIHWKAINKIWVTPLIAKNPLVDITVNITGESSTGAKIGVYFEKFLRKQTGYTHLFEYSLLSAQNFDIYNIRVSVTGHDDFNGAIVGSPNLRHIFIQTDKSFYKPEEEVNVRLLPLTEGGELYNGNLTLFLVDANGFKISRQDGISAYDRFAKTQFTLPKYLKIGVWRIEARPAAPSFGNSYFYDTRFNVLTYELPKFFVTMDLQESTEWNFLQVEIKAWYPHGMNVAGSVDLHCALQQNGQVSTNTRLVQLFISELTNGFWSGHPDITKCFEGSDSLPNSSQILIIAQIFDKGTTKTITVKKLFQPRRSGFKIIPLRPAFDESTETLRVFFDAILDPRLLASTEIEVTAQCISSAINLNGLNQSSQNFKSSIFMNGYFEFSVDSRCDVYIIRARRKLKGIGYSDTEYLVIPSVKSQNSFKLSFINPIDKVKYREGERFIANVKTGRALNYLVLCNSKYVAYVGTVRNDGLISFGITSEMEGYCILVVYGISNTWYARAKSDMWLFFVEKGNCQSPFSLSLSSSRTSLDGKVAVSLNGEPYSLATVHAIDSKLNQLGTTLPNTDSKTSSLPWDLEIFKNPYLNSLSAYKSTSPMKLSNFIDHASLIDTISNICKKAGEEMPGPMINKNGMDFEQNGFEIHGLCLRMLIESANKKLQKTSTDGLMDENRKPEASVMRAGFMQSPREKPKRPPQNDVMMMTQKVKETSLLDATEDVPDATDLVRSYFPEVWLFDDFELDDQGRKDITLTAPHSVTEWTFTGTFWINGRTSTCQTPPAKLIGRRHVFMQVDLPSYVYENETIPAKVTVTADNLRGTTNMAVCFTGLSPVVCGDVGPDGNVGETDYTRIVLNQTHPVVVKTMQMRFLREGPQNISFQLRPESNNPGGDWHCSESNDGVNDTVVHTVNVLKRVEQEEHYRNVIIYPQKRIIYPMAESGVSGDVRPLSLPFPDIITYTQKKSDDRDDEIFTDIEINTRPGDVVYELVLEFSKFRPSLSTGYELDETEDRAPNRPRMRRGKRQTNSLANVLMELSFATYELRSLETYSVSSILLASRKEEVGYLLSQLMSYSNCSSDKSKPCAFYLFGPPRKSDTIVQPSIFFTTLATSLLCEHNVEPEFVCGPINYLTTITKNGINAADLNFHDQINLSNEIDQLWFMRSFMRQMVSDCADYTCMKEHSNQTIKNLTHEFYNFSDRDQLDLRTEAMMAFQSSSLTEPLMRSRLTSKGKANQIPHWKSSAEKSYNNVLEVKFSKSADVLTNALAMLALTKDQKTFDYYRKLFDFDSMTNWLVESQMSNRQFETAIDTYFGWRSLYSYRVRQSPTGSGIRVRVNLTTNTEALTTFSTDEMPFSIRLPTATRKIRLQSVGDGKIIAGVRVHSSKRKRRKRDPSEAFPVVITASQQRIPGSEREIMQTICIETRSQLLNTLEIEHGLFTGFSTSVEDLQLLTNTTREGTELLRAPQLSATAIHLILIKLKPNLPLCYKIQILEPDSNYSPEYLAPVAITARYNDVMGQLFLSPEVSPAKRRRRKRDVIPELDLVDTVCLDNGNCTCAEKTCSVECDQCRFIKFSDICAELKTKPRFGAVFRVESSTTVKIRNVEYLKLYTDLSTWQSALPEPRKLTIWIRKCNPKCFKSLKVEPREGKPRFLIVGDEKGLFEDEHSIGPSTNAAPELPDSIAPPQVLQMHYLLRDNDRLEKSTGCQELLGEFADMNQGCVRGVDRFKRLVHLR